MNYGELFDAVEKLADGRSFSVGVETSSSATHDGAPHLVRRWSVFIHRRKWSKALEDSGTSIEACACSSASATECLAIVRARLESPDGMADGIDVGDSAAQ